MKILFVNEYTTARAVSGAEYSMAALAQALGAKMFTPRWKQNQPGKSLSPLWFNNPVYYLYSAWQIVKQGKFDIIHVHGKYILPGAIIAGWLKGKPVVITVRDFKFLCPLALCFIKQPVCSMKYFIAKEISEYQKRYGGGSKLKLILAKLWQYQLKWWLHHCRQVVAVSPQLKQIYQGSGVKKVISIYNLPPQPQKQVKGEIILSVGKLSYGKGTDMIIETAKLLPQYQFVFAGELNPSFKAEFPQNCRYLGRINHQETERLFRQAGVFVINSRWPEPLSRAGLEALSFGLPIVASNRGGNRELIKDNGFLVDPDKPREISAAIVKAIAKRQQLGENSFKLLTSRFNRRQILIRHLHLYESLCSKS